MVKGEWLKRTSHRRCLLSNICACSLRQDINMPYKFHKNYRIRLHKFAKIHSDAAFRFLSSQHTWKQMHFIQSRYFNSCLVIILSHTTIFKAGFIKTSSECMLYSDEGKLVFHAANQISKLWERCVYVCARAKERMRKREKLRAMIYKFKPNLTFYREKNEVT